MVFELPKQKITMMILFLLSVACANANAKVNSNAMMVAVVDVVIRDQDTVSAYRAEIRG